MGDVRALGDRQRLPAGGELHGAPVGEVFVLGADHPGVRRQSQPGGDAIRRAHLGGGGLPGQRGVRGALGRGPVERRARVDIALARRVVVPDHRGEGGVDGSRGAQQSAERRPVADEHPAPELPFRVSGGLEDAHRAVHGLVARVVRALELGAGGDAVADGQGAFVDPLPEVVCDALVDGPEVTHLGSFRTKCPQARYPGPLCVPRSKVG